MTCEITFEPSGEERSTERLREFVESRRWYEGTGSGASYRDEDTGVSFELRWTGEGGDFESLVFSMEYLRPQFFALEAAGELEALVGEFELAPRAEEADELGSFDPEDFLEGWERGNRAAVAAADEGDLPAHSAPAEDLRDAWRWNRARQEYQTVLGEALFAPSIRFVADDGEVRRACAWPETIPFALPAAADLVLLSGLEHEGLTSGESELRVAEADRVEEIVMEHTDEDRLERRSDPTDHLLIGWARPPGDVLEEFATLGSSGSERELTPLTPDQIVDRELLDETE